MACLHDSLLSGAASLLAASLPARATAALLAASLPARAALACPAPAAAQLTSDNPGFASSTSTASTAGPTVELSFNIEHDPNGYADSLGEQSYALPDLRLRFGLLPWLEVALDTPALTLTSSGPGGQALSVANPAFGLKLGGDITEHVGLSLRPSAVIPVDGQGATATIELNFAARVGLLTFGGNLYVASVPSAALDAEPGARGVQGAGSASVGVEPTSKLGLYVQSYFLAGNTQKLDLYAGAGAYVLVNPAVLLFAECNIGVVDTASRVVASTGITTFYDVARIREARTAAPSADPTQ